MELDLDLRAMKQTSWEAVHAAVPSAATVALVYFLLGSVIPTLVGIFTPSYTVEQLLDGRAPGLSMVVFLNTLVLLYTVVLSFGYRSWALRCARGRYEGPGALLDGFGMVGQVLWMELQIALRMAGWGLLFSLGLSILSGPLLFLLGGEMETITTVSFVLGVALWAFMLVMYLRYAQAPFLLWDHPEEGAGAAVRRSAEMMRTRTGTLLRLYLSFWPWFLGRFLLSALVDAVSVLPRLEELSRYVDSPAELFSAVQSLTNTPLNAVLGLTDLVFALIFTPYLQVTLANFYRVLSSERVTPSFSGDSF